MGTQIRDYVLLLHEEHVTLQGVVGSRGAVEFCPKCNTPWPCLAYKVATEAKEHEDELKAEKATLWRTHLAVVDARDKALDDVARLDALLHAIKLPANYDDAEPHWRAD